MGGVFNGDLRRQTTRLLPSDVLQPNAAPDQLDSLQIGFSNLAEPFLARGISTKEIARIANHLLHGLSISRGQTADPLLSVFYFLKDPLAISDVYVRYCKSTPSALGAVLQDPRRMIEFLLVFMQPLIKYLHHLVTNQTLELVAFGEACSKAVAKLEAIFAKLKLSFTEVRNAIVSNRQSIEGSQARMAKLVDRINHQMLAVVAMCLQGYDINS